MFHATESMGQRKAHIFGFDLLFRDFGPSTHSEVELSEEEEKSADGGQKMAGDDDVEVGAKGWDKLLIESDDKVVTTTNLDQ